MKLTKRQRKSLVAWCLKEGLSIEYGKLSLCDLTNFRHSHVYTDRRYQVHCEDQKQPWSAIYEDIEAATEKFLELKDKVKRIK